jgi:hypothetical protein
MSNTEELITFNGVQVAADWPAVVEAAQQETQYEIAGEAWPRIRYGQEKQDWASNPCHDCAVLKGQYHVPGCDAEECPKCGGQAISCRCDPCDDADDDEPA